ncbi:MAG: hypothetical protein M3Y42_19335 [Actinomycetota bacterium]|nr:hypothetical protein [Actinomycetota bacterium]MDQ2959096.1 hypothetical protein [Actinomycetota bacterium]
MKITRIRLSALAAGAVAATILCTAPSASASGSLQFTSGGCWQTGGDYYNAYIECDFAWSGGAGTVTSTYTDHDPWSDITP